MSTIGIVLIILWVIIGIMNIVHCAKGYSCTWLSYWCVYAVMIIYMLMYYIKI